MTAFNVQVSQNPYLARGSDLVHGVVSIISSTDSIGGNFAAGHRGKLAEAIILDCSGSMGGEKIRHARGAVGTAVQLLRDDSSFCIIAGNDSGRVIFPMSQASVENKRAAWHAVESVNASGGTAMSAWLDAASGEFRKLSGTINHALLLTDGKNESETPPQLDACVRRCEGQFQCDARGVGTDWIPDQLRVISGHLLGTVDIIPSPSEIERDFRAVIESAMSKSVSDVSLRVWTPMGAEVAFCRLVFPEKVDLTDRGRVGFAAPQTRDYPTGAWGEEKRDYHVAIRVKPGNVGQRMLAGRVSLIISRNGQETKASEAMILAMWTDDEAQSAIINPAVAHYTGQAELADTIREGLKARSAGDEQKATALLGRAVQIAGQTNPETMKLLRKVVEVEDEKQGTVKLLRTVRKEDEFALDTRSTKTARVKKPT